MASRGTIAAASAPVASRPSTATASSTAIGPMARRLKAASAAPQRGGAQVARDRANVGPGRDLRLHRPVLGVGSRRELETKDLDVGRRASTFRPLRASR